MDCLQLLEETLEWKCNVLSAINDALEEDEDCDGLITNYIEVKAQIALLRFLISKLADNDTR